MASSSSTASLATPRTLMELTTDPQRIEERVFNAIGRTATRLDGLLPPLTHLVVEYLKVQKEERVSGVFGEKEWADYLGSVPPAPALPVGIEEIWQAPCPIFAGKKTYETHLLVYIPKTVKGMPLTLKNLSTLSKQYFPDTFFGPRHTWSPIVNQFGDTANDKAYWILMTNEPIPESKGRSYMDQKNRVANLAKTALVAYEVPVMLDAAVCILTQFVSCRMHIFSDSHTRCQESFKNAQVVVGDFSPDGLFVYNSAYDYSFIAVAALKKFV